jgi:calcineurin-like phosphoesterase
VEKNGKSLLAINLNAQVFFEKQFPTEISSPFTEFDTIWKAEHQNKEAVFIDFHSEATSEKRAMGFYTDGRASLVCGTHTHVATADLQILPNGTGYISDVGMTGALNSILGVPVQNSLDLFLGNTSKLVFEVEEQNPIMINAVYAEIEDGKAVAVEKIYREVSI